MLSDDRHQKSLDKTGNLTYLDVWGEYGNEKYNICHKSEQMHCGIHYIHCAIEWFYPAFCSHLQRL